MSAAAYESTFWERAFHQIQSAQNYTISFEQLKTLLDKLRHRQQAVLEHDCQFEPFYSSLITFCTYTILKQIEFCMRDFYFFILHGHTF